ncbi:MAG: FAD-dependent oxidoreductase [Patescibacteria group bacterium]
MYDLVIIGGGPAGVAAAVYAARKLLKTVLITDMFGGQSVVSPEVQNWIGIPAISGENLAKAFEAHVRAYQGDVVTILKGDRVTAVSKNNGGFLVETKAKKTLETRSVLVASGGERRKLTVPGAAEFEQKGLTYCATCDGPLFSGSPVAVVGGGNAGFETAAQLLAYTESVTLLHRGTRFTADPVAVEKALAHPKMRGILNVDITKVIGDKFVTGISYKDKKTGAEETLTVSGVFVEVGMMPSTGFLNGLVDLDGYNRIIVDPRTQRTSQPGIWAAGDCTDGLFHQNNIAAGDAVEALEDIYLTLARS